MQRKRTLVSPKLGALYAAVVFLAIAIGGHLLFPTADLLWGLLAAFGLLAVPQVFFLERSERRRNGP